MRKWFLAILLAAACFTVPRSYAQLHPDSARKIVFPDIPGYKTLKTDLHMHTVFSDGSVWPDIRVQEAQRDGLDAIAITEHLEYQPHSHDIPHPDRNRAHAVAVESAGEDSSLIIITGSEITRAMPPGHANAIFIHDANALLVDDVKDAFREARRQGAFIFWNHPMWEGQVATGMASMAEIHYELIQEDLVDGVEVVNDVLYSDETLQIALDHDLTILGTSDVHGLIDWHYDVPHGGHRPVTLVFARERSQDGIKEALMSGRTVVWFDNLLVGREEFLVPLIERSVVAVDAQYRPRTTILVVEIHNRSDAEFILQSRGELTFHAQSDIVTVKPNGTTRLLVKTVGRKECVGLAFDVLNAVIAPGTHPTFTLEVPIEMSVE